MKKTLLTIALSLLCMVGMSAQTTQKNMENPAGTRVELLTSEGPVKVVLYDDTPLHRDNFVKLVKEGFYDGLLFHRVIKDFMVQTGDPDSRDAKPGQHLGAGSPDYTIPAEIVYPLHYNKRGALAAARTGDNVNPERRSSASQFYIVTGRKSSQREIDQMQMRAQQEALKDRFRQLCDQNAAQIDSLRKAGDRDGLEALRQSMIEQTEQSAGTRQLPQELVETYTTQGGAPHLDGAYTVFGEVTEGMDVIDRIQQAATDRADRPVEDIRIIKATVLDD